MPSSRSSKRPPPIRVPRRSNASDWQASGSLTNEQIDLFEHAVLLYHGYEWQAAADAFEILSQNIDDIDECVKCILNAGLIYARLGDYVQAATIFDEAAVLQPTLPIINFLIALVSIEQRNYDRAETCIELCLDRLGQAGVDYSPMRLKFVLERPALIRGLREVRTAQFHARSFNDRDSMVVRMDSIPAECIFEAPLRSDQGPGLVDHSARSRTRLRRLTQGGKSSESKSVATVQEESSYRPSWQASRAPASLQSLLQYNLPDAEEIQDQSPGISASGSASATASEPNHSTPASAVRSKHRTWHRRPSTPFIPRDARVGSESVRELARFIRELGQSKPATSLLPRNATGDYESVKELIRFIELYSPRQEDGTALTIDADIVADLRSGRMLDKKGEAALARVAGHILGEEKNRSAIDSRMTSADLDSGNLYHAHMASARSNRAAAERRRGATSHPRRKARPILDTPSTTASESDLPNEEILQPVVYRPPVARKRAQPASSDRTPISPSHTLKARISSSPVSSAHSFYGGTTSFDRRMKARQKTLKVLEGRPSEDVEEARASKKIVPSISDNCTTASSIDTVDFFSKVIERDKNSRW